MPSFREDRETLESWRAHPGRERLDPGSGRVALTFDDGPDPETTPLVLEALAAAAVAATFFVLGEQLLRRPRLVAEVAAEGHELALHGFGHERHDRIAPGQVRDDLARGVGAFEAAVGRRPRLFRPPHGRMTTTTVEACAVLGLEPVLWSAWGLDWEAIGAERIAELVGRDLADGAIVLLHDSARYAPRTDVAATARALPAIVAEARARGVEPVSLSGGAG
jgi:peptidoglycan/xylan/chitin deacetylase (PgdA/CDA1 family)